MTLSRERAPGAVPGQTGGNQSDGNGEFEHRKKQHHGCCDDARKTEIAQGAAGSAGVDEFGGAGEKENPGEQEPERQKAEFRESQHIATCINLNVSEPKNVSKP